MIVFDFPNLTKKKKKKKLLLFLRVVFAKTTDNVVRFTHHRVSRPADFFVSLLSLLVHFFHLGRRLGWRESRVQSGEMDVLRRHHRVGVGVQAGALRQVQGTRLAFDSSSPGVMKTRRGRPGGDNEVACGRDECGFVHSSRFPMGGGAVSTTVGLTVVLQ